MDKHRVMPETASRKAGFFYGYIMVLTASFILVIMGGILNSFGVFLKPLSFEFGWTRAMTSGAYSMGLFVMGLLYMVTGRLSDRFGPRIVMTVCGLLLGLGCLLMSRISALWQLYLFWGVIIAVSQSGGFVPMASTVARWFVRRRGMMVGIVTAGVGAGGIVIPLVASWLISSYDWRTSFTVLGIIALVLLILAAQFLKRDPSAIGQLPDGNSEAKQEDLPSEAWGFSLQEAVHTRQFWMLFALLFCFGFGVMAIMTHIVPHATDIGISTIIAASILATIGGLSIVGRIGIGSVSDKIGVRLSLVIGFSIVSVALLWLQLARELWMLYLFAIVFGFGTGGIAALESPLTAELFGLRAHGAVLGATVFGATIGAAIGSFLTGYMFDITNSYYSAFWVSAVISIIATVVASLLKPTHRGG
ncbi:MFS transporter [Chloroflexota bacterium]